MGSMGVMKLLANSIMVLGVIAVLLACLFAISTDPQPYSLDNITRRKLIVVSNVIKELAERGWDIEKCGSLDDLLLKASKEGLITIDDYTSHEFAYDSWGREIVLKKHTSHEKTKICVMSAGSDGVFDSPHGDDLAVVTEFPRMLKPDSGKEN
jgi:hypothetical protein